MDDMRNALEPQGSIIKLYPYAKNLFYHPSGVLSMTLEIYDYDETQQFSFGIQTNGALKDFLDQIYNDEPTD